MGLTTTWDNTANFNLTHKMNLDIGSWDYVTVQVESLSGTAFFNATNDAGAVQGVTDGNANLATGWQPVQGTNVATGATSTSSGAGSFIYKFNPYTQFLQLDGTGSTATVSKLIVTYYKIS
jgi:hypothetical protein